MNPEWVNAICSIVSTLAILFGAFLAYRGVDSWRRQLRGSTEYQLGLKILQSVYKIRNEIESTRNRYSLSSECDGRSKKENEDARESSLRDQEYVYTQRLKTLIAKERELYNVEFETAAAFGPKINDKLEPLHKCVRSLWSGMMSYFPARLAGTSSQDSSMQDKFKDLYEVVGSTDEFWGRVENAVETADRTFRPYLIEKPWWSSNKPRQAG